MAKTKLDVASRAWNLLRLTLLWARKGGVFGRRLMMEQRVVPKFLKSLGHLNNSTRGKLHYGEHELSFDKTPIFHSKMHRPASMRFNIPCITPQVDFDYDFDQSCDDHDHDKWRKSNYNDEEECGYDEDIIAVEEEGIDLRAEEFIAKFYEQVKLQK